MARRILEIAEIKKKTVYSLALTSSVSAGLVTVVLLTLLSGNQLAPWILMWTLAFELYAFFKWITLAYHPRASFPRYRWLYLLAWPGMDPVPFQVRGARQFDWPLVRQGLLNLSFGIFLFFIARQLSAELWYAQGWLICAAIVFILHFGVFHLLAAVLKANGFDVAPIMRFPLGARSVSEFWSGRWNVAFTDLVQPFLYHPLKERFGKAAGVLATFAVSGMIHDLVISLPSRGGWGLPTLYFLFQAGALQIERSLSAKARASIQFRVFTYAVILLPAPLLFHPWFMYEVIVPFARAVGM